MNPLFQTTLEAITKFPKLPRFPRPAVSVVLLLLVTVSASNAVTLQVRVADDVFDPKNITIHPGDTVQWVWQGSLKHSATSGSNGAPSGLFDSGVKSSGTFSHTFPNAGTYPYYCVFHYMMGMTGSVTVTSVTPTPTPGRLGNISTRLQVGTNNDVLIGGFIVGGTGSKQLVLRGLGPTLTQFGVIGALADPTLELRNSSGGLLAFNDNWAQAANAQSIPANLRPPNSLEPAILTNLNPGSYTAIVRGINNTTGVGLVEGYDIAPGATSHLTNISTRGLVRTGNDVMIAGVIVQSNNQAVLVRALGPTLASFGITNPLANPTLELRDVNGTLLAFNDNWKSTQQAQITATGKAPPNDLESGIVRTLAPGSYTATVRGVSNTTGVALVEVYTLP